MYNGLAMAYCPITGSHARSCEFYSSKMNTTVRVEAAGVPVGALLLAEGVTPEVAERIIAADVDGSGALSVEEVLRIFRTSYRVEAQGRLMRRQGAKLIPET